jgi:hypothetical protein
VIIRNPAMGRATNLNVITGSPATGRAATTIPAFSPRGEAEGRQAGVPFQRLRFIGRGV